VEKTSKSFMDYVNEANQERERRLREPPKPKPVNVEEIFDMEQTRKT